MTPEEKRRGAFEQFDELLAERLAVDDAVARAATDNALEPANFRVIAEKQFGDLHEYAANLQLRATNAAILVEVRLAASKRHPKNAFCDSFDLDEVASRTERRIGWSITKAEVSKIEEVYRDIRLSRVRNLVGKYRTNA